MSVLSSDCENINSFKERMYETIPFSDESFPIRLLLDMQPNVSVESEGKFFISWHEQIEIVYVLEGTLLCECDFRHYVCSKGDVVVINPCEAHTFSFFEQPARYHCLMFDPKLCGGRDDMAARKYLEPITDRRIRFNNMVSAKEESGMIIEELIRAYTERKNGYELDVKGNLLRLMALFLRGELADEEDTRKGNGNEAIIPVLRYIADNYTRDITLAELAGECCMNRSYFCRQFREITGRTAIYYVNEYRLAKAKALILTTTDSVSEIAAATGFADSSYFTRKFKEMYGVSPTGIKKQV